MADTGRGMGGLKLGKAGREQKEGRRGGLTSTCAPSAAATRERRLPEVERVVLELLDAC